MPEITEQKAGLRRIFLTAILLTTFVSMNSCGPDEKLYSLKDVRVLNQWIDSHPEGPSFLMVREIESGRSVLFAQDDVLRADSIAMLEGIIPTLNKAGIRQIGVFFLKTDSQELIDSYISGESEISDSDIVRSSNPKLGYTEYCHFLHSIRDFNKGLKINNQIRLTALDTGSSTSVAILENMLSGDTPVFVWVTADEIDKMTIEGDSVSPVLLSHLGPVADGLAYGGLIEATVATRDSRDRNFSYRTDESPFLDWPEISGTGKTEIVIVTSFEYAAVTPVEHFISAENLADVTSYFPGIGNDNMPESQARKINRQIARDARLYGKYLSKLQ